MDMILGTIYIGGVVIFFISQHIYFKLVHPECKSCGWLTKENGKCCGCGSARHYKWQ